MGKCENCVHFVSNATPERVAAYEKRCADYAKDRQEYEADLERWQRAWGLARMFSYMPWPPFPPGADPRTTGQCHLNPEAVKVGVDHHCSHFAAWVRADA